MIKYFLIKTFSLFPTKLLYFFEVFFAACQGKGYALPSLNLEIKSVLSLINNHKIKIILDIGAHEGEYTDELLKIFQNSKYFLFEPSNRNYILLKNKFKRKKNVKIFNFALSNKNGKGILSMPVEGSLCASLTKRNWDHVGINFNKNENVKIKKFKNIYDIYLKNSTIDFCKIDVEGHELNVLLGFENYINKCKIIQFELGDAHVDSRFYFKDFWNFFKNKKFTIYRITASGPKKLINYSEIDEYFRITNFIAVNNKILK